MRRRAFSLIELLVVIGIIGILLGILLPVTARARREAKKVACKAQLANIGAAFQMYLNENDGWYPPATYWPESPSGLPQVNEFLQRYISNVNKVFGCPADEKNFEKFKLSYSYYQELGERRIQDTFFYKILRSSSRTPIMWDAENYHGGNVPYNWLFADGHVDQFLQHGTPTTMPSPFSD